MELDRETQELFSESAMIAARWAMIHQQLRDALHEANKHYNEAEAKLRKLQSVVEAQRSSQDEQAGVISCSSDRLMQLEGTIAVSRNEIAIAKDFMKERGYYEEFKAWRHCNGKAATQLAGVRSAGSEDNTQS